MKKLKYSIRSVMNVVVDLEFISTTMIHRTSVSLSFLDRISKLPSEAISTSCLSDHSALRTNSALEQIDEVSPGTTSFLGPAGGSEVNLAQCWHEVIPSPF